MDFKTVKINKENKVASIEINRPDVLNAFNSQLIWDLQEATKLMKDDDNIRVVVLSGSGRAFIIVTTTLIAPIIDEAPIIWTEKIKKVTLGGAYVVDKGA